MFLPELLYCNRNKVVNQLSMLVDDLAPQYAIRELEAEEQGAEVGGEVSSSLGNIIAKYKKEGSKTVEREGIVQSTSASLFRDLRDILKEEGELQELLGFDDEIAEQLNIGEIIELTGEVTLSPIEVVFSTLEDGIRSYGGTDQLEQNAEAEDIQMLQTMLNSSNKATYLVDPINEDVSYTFVTDIKLSEENMFVDDIQEISGRLTVLGRIKRFVPASQEVDMIKKYLPGDLQLDRNVITDMINGFSSSFSSEGVSFSTIDKLDMSSFFLKGPVFEIKPTVIYREEREL